MKTFPFLYESHLHTSETSCCGRTSGAEMAKQYIQLGFSGIFVTDHFVTGYSYAAAPSLLWEQRIDIMQKGYLSAKTMGAQRGLDVFFAWEHTINGADFLTYGLDASFLYAHPELPDLSAKEYYLLVHSNNGFVVQAHPYREEAYIPNGIAGLIDGCYDAIEVYNGSHKNAYFNQRAYEEALKRCVPMIAGSDTHSLDMSQTAYMAFDHRLNDSNDFIQTIRSGNYKLMRGML